MAKKELKAEGEKKYWSGDRDATFAQICELLSTGETLHEICRRPGMPGVQTVYDWKDADPDKSVLFAHARARGFDVIAESCLEIADVTPPTTETGGTDSGYVQHQKLRIETRLKLLAKWDPKRFGEKVAVEHSGEIAAAPLSREAALSAAKEAEEAGEI